MTTTDRELAIRCWEALDRGDAVRARAYIDLAKAAGAKGTTNPTVLRYVELGREAIARKDYDTARHYIDLGWAAKRLEWIDLEPLKALAQQFTQAPIAIEVKELGSDQAMWRKADNTILLDTSLFDQDQKAAYLLDSFMGVLAPVVLGFGIDAADVATAKSVGGWRSERVQSIHSQNAAKAANWAQSNRLIAQNYLRAAHGTSNLYHACVGN